MALSPFKPKTMYTSKDNQQPTQQEPINIHPFLEEIVGFVQADLLEQIDTMEQLQRYVLGKTSSYPAAARTDELRSVLEGMRYLHRQKMNLSVQQLSFDVRRTQMLKSIADSF